MAAKHCSKCCNLMVRIRRKPSGYECRNPKCKDIAAKKLNPDKLFPSLKK